MGNLYDPSGEVDLPPSGGYYGYTGQHIVAMGGGLRMQLVPNTSDNETLESIQRQGIIPIAFARNDSVDMAEFPTQISLGDANQPVSGGLAAPTGLWSAYQAAARYESGYGHDSGATPVVAPQLTQLRPGEDPWGLLV